MDSSRNLGTLLVAILICAHGAIAADPAAQRQDAASAPAATLRAQMEAKLPAWTSAAMDAPTRAKAADAISGVSEAIYQSLQDAADATDTEVKLRIKEVRADLLLLAELKRAQASLSPARRKDLDAFAQSSRAKFEAIFSETPTPQSPTHGPTGMPLQILPVSDASPENETVLIACLLYGSKMTSRSAAELVNGSSLKSPELIDALTRAVVYPVAAGYYPDATRNPYSYGQGDAWPSCLAALETAGAKRAGPVLLAALLKPKKLSPASYHVDSALAQTIATLADRRMIPVLLAAIEKRMANSATMPAGKDFAAGEIDPLIECAHRLSGAGPAMTRINVNNVPRLVFKRDADRQEALDQIRQWVRNNQPATDAQALVVPDLEQWLRPIPPPAAVKYSFPTADAQALVAQVSQTCRQAVKDLGHARLARRQSAQKTLHDVYEAYLDTLVACADRPDGAFLAGEVLDRAVSLSVLESLRPGLDADAAKKLLEARKALPREFDDVFALESLRCVAGIRALAAVGADKKPAAEGVLLFCLAYPSEDIAMAAIGACADGNYKSDEIVSALAERMLGDGRTFGWVQHLFAPQHAWPQVEALKSLKVIRTPLAISAIASGLTASRYYDQYRTIAISEALIDVGDKSAIASLMTMIDTKRGAGGAWNMPQGKKMTSSDGDAAMYVVLMLSGQRPEDYGMVCVDNALGVGVESPKVYGFEKEQARGKAVEQLRKWWDENKSRPPYDQLKPLPEPPKPRKSPAAQPEPAIDTSGVMQLMD